MIKITLPSGELKEFNNPVSPLDVVKEISSSLAKDALIASVDNILWDLERLIEKDCSLKILTKKDPETLSVLRHDAAHVMAEAVLELFPDTEITIGPAIEDGFYYDFFRNVTFSIEDLQKIEKRMHKIVERNETIAREVWSRDKASKFFKENKEKFKLELLNDIPENEEVTFYKQGNFIDLCRGPHFRSTKFLGHSFKLMKLAGSYWRGDSKKRNITKNIWNSFLF